VDASRSRGSGGGSGLGLSIVSAVVAAHGGRVSVHPTSGGGATFRVEIPPAASGSAQQLPPATETFVTIPSLPATPDHQQPDILDSLPRSRTDPAM
jgi:hypothetical protein